MAGTSKVAMRSLLRGGGHLGKDAAKFQFDLTIEKISGLHSGPHTIKWTRGAKVAYTKPFQVERRSKDSLAVGQKISLLCTLYRSRNSSNANCYDAKDSKISLVSLKNGKKSEKTIGKVHFNIAEYAGVPSSQFSAKFKLNSKVRVELSITCTFVQVSKQSGSSAGSGLSGLTVSSGDPEPEHENEDDLEHDPEGPGEELEEISSPVTQKEHTHFSAMRSIFAEENDRATSLEATQISNAFSNFSSRNTEEQTLGPSSESSTEQPLGTNFNSLNSLTAHSRKKVKPISTTCENEAQRQQEIKYKKELEKCKQLNKVNEEVIIELRQVLSKNEMELRSCKVQQETALDKVKRLREDIANMEMRASQQAEDHEERLKAMRIQIESCAANAADFNSSENVQHELDRKSLMNERDVAESKLKTENTRRRRLEQECGNLQNEVSHMRSKIQEDEQKSLQTKQMYEELSSMYSELREQHKLLQQERTFSQRESLSGIAQSSGHSDRNGLSLRGKNETGQKMQQKETLDFSEDVGSLRSSLQDAKSKILDLHKEKNESDRKYLNLSQDLELVKSNLEKSRNESSKYSKDCESLKAQLHDTFEKLEDSERMSHHLRQEKGKLDDHASLKTFSVNCTSQKTRNVILSRETQEKIMKIVRAAAEAKNTIQKMREDLQEAYDREEYYENEIRRQKGIIEESTQLIKLSLEGETVRREQQAEQLQKAVARAEEASTSVETIVEKEMIYREQIADLERAYENLQENVKATKESSDMAISANRQELKLKEDELENASYRIQSLERELSSKKKVTANLVTKSRELELEREIIKKQAFHEVALAKQALKEEEDSRMSDACQANNYKTEIDSLKAVAENLRSELQRSQEKAEIDIRVVHEDASENRRLREQAEEKNLHLGNELNRQKAVVDSLQEKLQDSVKETCKAAKKSSDEAGRRLQTFEANRVLQEELEEHASKLQQRETKITELKSQLQELTCRFEESTSSSETALEKSTKRLEQKELLLYQAVEKEEVLRQKIKEQESQVSSLQSKLTLALESTLELYTTKETNELENKNLRLMLNTTEEQLRVKQEYIDRLNDDGKCLADELSTIKVNVGELQEMVASLRTALTESESKLAAAAAASVADTCRTSIELEEVRNREETYLEDISKKNALIEDLTSKLTAAVGKSAVDSARGQAELSEALSREEKLKDELERRKQALEDLEDEVMRIKSSSAFASANMEADLAEALSREENYRFELKRLKGVIKDLEKKLEGAKENERQMRDAENDRRQRNESSQSSATILQGVEAKTKNGMRANKAMAEVLGLGDSLSSSNIRRLDVFEKITDARLLEMLVETKMQLALAEEEKLQLEHLIRRVRDGDEHVQQKVAQQAAKLEIKLSKGNAMIDSIQNDRSRDFSRRESDISESNALARHRSVMKGDQLQFFRDQTGVRNSPNTAERRNGGRSRRKPQIAAPAHEWDIGDDNHDDGQSQDSSQSQESSFPESSSDTE